MKRGQSGIDVIGDIHGALPQLIELLESLGYRESADFQHPEGRAVLFLGDLVDRGVDHLGVLRLVKRMVEAGSAIALMGNHEYNLVMWHFGLMGPKSSNGATIDEIESDPGRWEWAFEFMMGMPLAYEGPGFRAIHAVWHQRSIDDLKELGLTHGQTSFGGPASGLADHVVIGSPFIDDGLHPDLPTWRLEVTNERAHEVVMKGYEEPSEPFLDSKQCLREAVRVTWWNRANAPVPASGVTLFGHYWNLPPTESSTHTAPPHSSGTPALRAWLKEVVSGVTSRGKLDLLESDTAICVDFNGVNSISKRVGVGSYRWPEHQLVWICREQGIGDG